MAYEKKAIKVNGHDYELQRMAFRQFMELRDKCKENGVVMETPYYEGLLNNILVNPKMTYEEFDEPERIGDFAEVIEEILTFQQGTKNK